MGAVGCHLVNWEWCQIKQSVLWFQARGSAVGWDTALQARRLQVRYLMVSLEFFSDNPSSCTMALKSTLPPKEMSTRNIAWGVKVANEYSWPPLCADCLETWEPYPPLEPSVPVQACRGIALPLSLCYSSWNNPNNLSAMDLPSGKYSTAQMGIHSGFWVGWGGLFWQAQSRPTAGIL